MNITSNSIYLIGFMGVGKTTNGKLLSQVLQTAFVETDAIIEERCQMAIPDIFAARGEAFFRQQEMEVLQELSALDERPRVVSCGGGIIVTEWCRRFLRRQPFCFLLTASVENCYQRTLGSDRPLLQHVDAHSRIKQLLEARREHYHGAARFVISTDDVTPTDICRETQRILIQHDWGKA